MAKPIRTANVHLRLKYKSNIPAHLKWVEYLAGPEFVADWKRNLQTKKNIQAFVDSARKIVEEDIYAYNTTPGTGRIKESFKGFYFDQPKSVTAIVFSDPDVATSKGPFESGDPDRFSYAAFFEDPRFNSFIPPRDDPIDRKRFRPFFFQMSLAQADLSKEIARRNILHTVRLRMPRLKNVSG